MSPLLAPLLGGQLFFVGLFLLLVGSILFSRRFGLTSILLGLAILAISATPVPQRLAGILGLALATHLILHAPLILQLGPNHIATLSRLRQLTLAPLILLIAVAATQEFNHQKLPAPISFGPSPLHVIGDSLSAGMSSTETPWPTHLSILLNHPVKNWAQPGARTHDTDRQIQTIPPTPATVLVFIGGNDLLRLGSSLDFEHHLRHLITTLQTAQHSVVIMELPLYPGASAFGHVQRRLARELRCTLLPKRLLAYTLTSPGATTDGLHLSPSGHRQLASSLAPLFKPPASPIH